MPRLIDADKVAEAIAWLDEYDFVIWHDVMECIDKVPEVDIDAITESHEKIGYDKGFRDGYAQATSEVRHGRWIKKDSWYYCSECGTEVFFTGTYDESQRYCYNCGAKMDKDSNYS